MLKFEPVHYDDVLRTIENANDREMEDIFAAVQRRYKKFYPEWEVMYVACPKNNPAERQRLLTFLLNYFEEHT